MFTYSNGRTHSKRRSQRPAVLWDRVLCEEKIHNSRKLACQDDDRNEHERAQQVSVPRQMESAPFDDIQTLLDHHGVDGGNHRACNTEADANHRHRNGVEEHSYEETSCDNRTCSKNQKGWSGVQEEEGCNDGERQDHSSRNLIERRVDICESVIAEAVEK